MENARCSITYDEGIVIIKLLGDIDHHSAAPIREEIDTSLYIYRAGTVILDLSLVDFMDSSGLGLILGRYRKITALGGQLVIADPSPSAEKLLKLAGTEKIITIKRSERRPKL